MMWLSMAYSANILLRFVPGYLILWYLGKRQWGWQIAEHDCIWFVRFCYRRCYSADSRVLAAGSCWRIRTVHPVWSLGNVRWHLGDSDQWFVYVFLCFIRT